MKRTNGDERTLLLLSDEHRAEWIRLERVSKTGGTVDGWVNVISLIASVVLAVSAVLAFVGSPFSVLFFVLAGVTLFVFFAGEAISTPLERRARARAEARMRELRWLARDAPVRRGPARSGATSAPDDGTNWKKYPVTGVYDPETYRARGGRSTASGMAAWGIEDYETYRSNIE